MDRGVRGGNIGRGLAGVRLVGGRLVAGGHVGDINGMAGGDEIVHEGRAVGNIDGMAGGHGIATRGGHGMAGRTGRGGGQVRVSGRGGGRPRSGDNRPRLPYFFFLQKVLQTLGTGLCPGPAELSGVMKLSNYCLMLTILGCSLCKYLYEMYIFKFYSYLSI